jgi:hypothetical protein
MLTSLPISQKDPTEGREGVPNPRILAQMPNTSKAVHGRRPIKLLNSFRLFDRALINQSLCIQQDLKVTANVMGYFT